MIDIHTHILPGVDDGAADPEQARAMLDMAAAAGTRVLVATPHADLRYSFDPDRCRTLLNDLQPVAPESLRLCSGCEVHLTPENIDGVLRAPAAYSLGGADCILLELPWNAHPPMVEPAVEALMHRGLRVIVAHPERYPFIQQQPAFAERLVHAGCYLQLTAGSLTGSFGPAAETSANLLLNRRLAHFVASDAHGLDRRRPVLSPAWTKVAAGFGAEAADLLMNQNPAAALSGAAIRVVPPRSRWLSGFWGRSHGTKHRYCSTQVS